MNARLDKLRHGLQQQGLEAILITRPENQRYLSGFTGGEGALLITPHRAMLLTDFRYFDQVAEEAPNFELVKVESKTSLALERTLQDLQVRTLGFESTHVPFSLYQEWKKACKGTKWVPTQDVVETLRLIKEEGELATLRKAVKVADKACEHIRNFIKVGMSEKQVAWELESYMRTHGAEGIAFGLIVGAGPNGAKPHAVPQDRPIQKHEPIVLDLGATVDGYHSDLTRTICLGKPDAKLQEIYEIVLQAQLAAEKAAKAGITGKELDAVARDVITEAGYKDYFGHGLGHGVGLAVHEGPRVSAASEHTLEPGMTCTIEPGIYLSGWGGVRIEDLVVIREEGIEVLSQAHKELRAR